MLELGQFADWFDDDGITLPPIKSKAHPEGKAYTVPSPDYDTGLLLQSLASIATRLKNGVEVPEEEARRLQFADGKEEQDFSSMVLGEALVEMRADGVPWGPVRKAVQYVFTYFAIGAEQADKLVTKVPKAVPANRTARRKKNKKRS